MHRDRIRVRYRNTQDTVSIVQNNREISMSWGWAMSLSDTVGSPFEGTSSVFGVGGPLHPNVPCHITVGTGPL